MSADPSKQPSPGPREHNGAYTGWGISAGWECLIGYILGWITGLIVVLSEQECYYCVFHGFQSIVLSVFFTILMIIAIIIDEAVIDIKFPIIWFIWLLLYLLCFGICIYFGFKYEDSGKCWKFPPFGHLAKQLADKYFPTKCCEPCCV